MTTSWYDDAWHCDRCDMSTHDYELFTRHMEAEGRVERQERARRQYLSRSITIYQEEPCADCDHYHLARIEIGATQKPKLRCTCACPTLYDYEWDPASHEGPMFRRMVELGLEFPVRAHVAETSQH